MFTLDALLIPCQALWDKFGSMTLLLTRSRRVRYSREHRGGNDDGRNCRATLLLFGAFFIHIGIPD